MDRKKEQTTNKQEKAPQPKKPQVVEKDKKGRKDELDTEDLSKVSGGTGTSWHRV